MYLCITTVVDFNSQNFDPPPLIKFDKYSPADYLDRRRTDVGSSQCRRKRADELGSGHAAVQGDGARDERTQRQ